MLPGTEPIPEDPDERFYGNKGRDRIEARGPSTDHVFGGGGNDWLDVGDDRTDHSDKVRGGPGADLLVYDRSDNVRGGPGSDRCVSTPGLGGPFPCELLFRSSRFDACGWRRERQPTVVYGGSGDPGRLTRAGLAELCRPRPAGTARHAEWYRAGGPSSRAGHHRKTSSAAGLTASLTISASYQAQAANLGDGAT